MSIPKNETVTRLYAESCVPQKKTVFLFEPVLYNSIVLFDVPVLCYRSILCAFVHRAYGSFRPVRKQVVD